MIFVEFHHRETGSVAWHSLTQSRIGRAMSSTISKAEAAKVLRRAGYSAELIGEILDQFADPIDLDRDARTLMKYGLTRESLINTMGGSP
jgi:hypothetical protein